jgi:hypothetical protein
MALKDVLLTVVITTLAVFMHSSVMVTGTTSHR